MPSPINTFILQSRRYLSAEYLPKINACVERLGEDDIWWRPNETSNSVGNLILHLAGNVRQWIVVGLGGAADTRDRAAEFAAREGAGRAELMANLEAVIHQADRVLDQLDRTRLAERLTIQGREVTVLEAVYHVVEHFAMHTGQIAYITKLRTGEDLGFYRVTGDIVSHEWEAPTV